MKIVFNFQIVHKNLLTDIFECTGEIGHCFHGMHSLQGKHTLDR